MSPRHVSLLLACLVLSARLSGSRAAPARLTLEQGGRPGVAGRLLGALVTGLLRPAGADRQQQLQREEEEAAQWEAEPLAWDGSPERGVGVAKRCAGLSTCVVADLTERLHRLNGPRTSVGVDTPGRKRRELPSSSSSPAGTPRGPLQAPGGVPSSSSSTSLSSSSPKAGSLPPRAV